MGEWRDISSAPRDGSEVLIYSRGKVVVGVFQMHPYPEHRWVGTFGDLDTTFDPTHWMPLPLPPDFDEAPELTEEMLSRSERGDEFFRKRGLPIPGKS